MLVTGHENGCQNGMRLCPLAIAVAAIRLARDDRRTQHAFGQVIGGIQLIHIQEAQEMRTVFTQAFGKTVIVGIRETALWGDQNIQARFQSLGSLMEGEWIQAGFLCLQVDGILQEDRHLAGKVQGSATFGLLEHPQFSQQMAGTFLFQPLLQSPVFICHETV